MAPIVRRGGKAPNESPGFDARLKSYVLFALFVFVIPLAVWQANTAESSSAKKPTKQVTTQSGGLGITNITDNRASYGNSQIPKFQKFEITFDVNNTVATNFQMPYDPSPPAGIDPANYPLHRGINVDVWFSADGFTTVYKQPAFYYQFFDDQVRRSWDGGDHDWYYPTGQVAWKARFAPDKEGTWQYKIVAQDASGQTVSSVQSFNVSSSSSKGFVRVSKTDSRYFEFDDGSPFYLTGLAGHLNADDPELKNEPLFQQYKQNNISLLRIWLSGLYGSAWLEWLGGRDMYDGYLPRSGLEPFRDVNTGKQYMTQRLDFDSTGWYDACRRHFYTDTEAVKPNTNYKLRIRYWGFGIAGPRVSTHPNFGLVGKMSTGFISNCQEPGTATVITNYGGSTSGWGFVEGNWNSGSNNFVPRIHFALENATGGKVYVESVSLREDLGNGQFGPEVLMEHSMQYETYISQISAYGFDKVLELAEKNDIYLKLVLMEKQDSIFSKIDNDGTFVIDGEPDNANGFYGLGRTVNKTRWLQNALYRYAQARWGYSPNIHSWELTNEGDPALSKHYEMTDELGKFMHCRVFGVPVGTGDSQKCQFSHPNRHMVTTSFWHSFPGSGFWGNGKYPNVDYADIHAYISTSYASATDKALMERDSAYYHAWHSQDLAGWKIGKPIVRGEAGMDKSGSQSSSILGIDQDTRGIWFHKYMWATLHPGGLHEVYWWVTEHIANSRFDHRHVFSKFSGFVNGISLNNGRYVDAAAASSNTSIRAWGQKDAMGGNAHLWIDNKTMTWYNVVKSPSSIVTIPAATTVTFSGMMAGRYNASWYDTYAGSVVLTETVDVPGDGVMTLRLPYNLDGARGDVAVKVAPNNAASPTGTPTPTPTSTPAVSPTPTASMTVTPTPTSSVTVTPTPSPTVTPTATPKPRTGGGTNPKKR
jgi:hypothetical protein